MNAKPSGLVSANFCAERQAGRLLPLQGVPKSGLMGFCDVALTDDRLLLINYLWQGSPYSITLADKASCT